MTQNTYQAEAVHLARLDIELDRMADACHMANDCYREVKKGKRPHNPEKRHIKEVRGIA